MSSKADDFDVRYRGVRNGHPWDNGSGGDYGNGVRGDHETPEGHGVLGGSGVAIDYDLGYDASGWDTQGFRSPAVGYPDDRAHLDGTGHLDGAGRLDNTGRLGSGEAGLGDAEELRWDQAAPTSAGPWVPARPGRRGAREKPRAKSPVKVKGPPVKVTGQGQKVKGSWWRHWTLRKALGVLLGVIGALIALGAIAVAVAYEETPVPTDAMAATTYAQSLVYSSNGTLIGRFGTTDRQMLSYGQIPQTVIDAVLAAEDRHFWTEGGVSPAAIMRAAYEDVRGDDGSLQGGSTITQQFVRNYYSGIGTEQTLTRKIKEIFVAMKIAKEKSKQWILVNYLNTIYLGDGAYGVGAAAQTYFDTPVADLNDLSVAQAAVIAAMIQQPSTYPLPQYHADLVARWRYVLNGMVQMGTLSAQQAAEMKFPKLGDYTAQTVGSDPWDPYVLQMVYNELTQVYHFSQSQIYNGGYTIRTTINDADMRELYQAVEQNEVAMAQGGVPLPDDAQVGAVLENPADGAIEAIYPGPGYPNSDYVDHDGATHKMTVRECAILDCEVNMAVYNREQVGSSFKPYVLATAVSEGMDVKTSTLNGFDPLWIPPATPYGPNIYATNNKADTGYQWHEITNDSASEDGPFTPQMAMAESINTAYASLWQRAGAGAVLKMAQLFGVDTSSSGLDSMQDEVGVALGQASLTVAEQATMLATIDDGGIYHDAHVIESITQNGMATPIQITSYPVFDPGNPTLNAEEATQVQYAMSEDTASYGTAPTAAMSNGQEIIAKTGTTTNFTSAFFIGAIPTQALAVGIFVDHPEYQQLPSDLGGNSQGGYGGTWPATIWHTYAENEFVPLGVEQFQPPVFTGQTWNLVPPGLRNVGKTPHQKKDHGGFPPGLPFQPPQPGNPLPYPTYSCDPQVVTCNPNTPPFSGGNTQTVNATRAGAAAAGGFVALPATCLWVRRRTRTRRRKRG